MLNTVSLDTSVIVRILADQHTASYRKILKLLDQDLNFVVFDMALLETIYVLEKVYHKSRAEICDLILFFLAKYDDKIDYNRSLTRAVFPFYLEHPKLSFADCCLATYAEINNAEPLMTLDKKLATQHPSAKLI